MIKWLQYHLITSLFLSILVSRAFVRSGLLSSLRKTLRHCIEVRNMSQSVYKCIKNFSQVRINIAVYFKMYPTQSRASHCSVVYTHPPNSRTNTNIVNTQVPAQGIVTSLPPIEPSHQRGSELTTRFLHFPCYHQTCHKYSP
jgi:hypothetical protein